MKRDCSDLVGLAGSQSRSVVGRQRGSVDVLDPQSSVGRRSEKEWQLAAGGARVAEQIQKTHGVGVVDTDTTALRTIGARGQNHAQGHRCRGVYVINLIGVGKGPDQIDFRTRGPARSRGWRRRRSRCGGRGRRDSRSGDRACPGDRRHRQNRCKKQQTAAGLRRSVQHRDISLIEHPLSAIRTCACSLLSSREALSGAARSIEMLRSDPMIAILVPWRFPIAERKNASSSVT
jgi:hypothetical protein